MLLYFSSVLVTQIHSHSVYLLTSLSNTLEYLHASKVKNVDCFCFSSPPSFSAASHSTSNKTDLMTTACPLTPIMSGFSRTNPLALQPVYSPRLDGTATFSFALINCHSTLNKFDHLKSFPASSSQDIIFITEP